MQTSQLVAKPLLQISPIQRRANCKIVAMNNKYYLIGGMTADAISNTIYQFRLNQQYKPSKLQWKLIHFDNNIFTPRNSFAACASSDKIYIFGGLQIEGVEQKCLNDLIQVDIEKGRMRQLSVKNKFNIHSTSLVFIQQTKQLIAVGGTDQQSKLPCYLYRLKLEKQQLEWQKISINFQGHQGILWQHSATYTQFSLFDGKQGKFLTIVGGCRYPQSPYNTIVQLNLINNQQSNNIKIDYGIVSHDTIIRSKKLYIFGGSNGGDFSSLIFVLQNGKISKLKGHRAIGCSCGLIENKMIIYGGVCGQTSINGAFMYQ